MSRLLHDAPASCATKHRADRDLGDWPRQAPGQMGSFPSYCYRRLRRVALAAGHETKLTGIRRMGSGLDARMLEFGVVDKAEPSWSAPRERRTADNRPKPLS